MILPQNIIIVEDEVITQRYLQDIFSQYDVQVCGCFNNAQDTLSSIKELTYDMILMDINIKGAMDGIQLAREILRFVTVPIVFISAHNDDETLEELLELAPYGFIGKPFSSKELIVTLQIAYKRYLTHSTICNEIEQEYLTDVMIDEKYRYSHSLGELYGNDCIIKLNQKQSKLLKILVESTNHTVRYDLLVSRIWGDTNIADSALRTLVYSLRKSLPDFPIVSHSKVGYMLVTNDK